MKIILRSSEPISVACVNALYYFFRNVSSRNFSRSQISSKMSFLDYGESMWLTSYAGFSVWSSIWLMSTVLPSKHEY